MNDSDRPPLKNVNTTFKNFHKSNSTQVVLTTPAKPSPVIERSFVDSDPLSEMDHLYLKQPPASKKKHGSSQGTTKDMLLPTPPGSPEGDRRWQVPQDGDLGHQRSSLLSSLDYRPTRDTMVVSQSTALSLKAKLELNAKVSTTPSNCLSALPTCPNISILPAGNSVIARALASSAPKRCRGEKKPIPDEQKDTKYFERRKRNNMAAKKSRDARKSREDQIALRASLLEKEHAVLRAQVATLREEANSLRQLLIQKRHNRVNS